MLLTAKNLTTAKDYERLPEGAPYQLIAGELIMSPSPTPFHQRIIRRLAQAIETFAEERGLGEVFIAPLDVHLTVIDVYQPDLFFIRKENLSKIDWNDRVRIVPDLVVEVLSPSTQDQDYSRKKKIYCECGVAEYWIVDPLDCTVEVMVN